MFTNLSAARLGAFDIDAVHELHEIEMLLLYRHWLTVIRRTIQLQSLALPNQRKIHVTHHPSSCVQQFHFGERTF